MAFIHDIQTVHILGKPKFYPKPTSIESAHLALSAAFEQLADRDSIEALTPDQVVQVKQLICKCREAVELEDVAFVGGAK